MASARYLLALALMVWAVAGCLGSPPPGEQRQTIAVWDLEDVSPGPAATPELGELLANAVVGRLEERGGGNIRIVERQRLLLALEELNLGSSALADESTRLRVGRIIGARMMVFGAYQVVGEQARVDLRLVEVETGRISKTAEATTSAGGMAVMLAAAAEAAGDLLPIK